MQITTPRLPSWQSLYYALAIILASVQALGTAVVGLWTLVITRGARQAEDDHSRADTDHLLAETQHLRLETAGDAIELFWKSFRRMDELGAELQELKMKAARVDIAEAENRILAMQNQKMKALCTLHGIEVVL
jgi:hypothetical protein